MAIKHPYPELLTNKGLLTPSFDICTWSSIKFTRHKTDIPQMPPTDEIYKTDTTDIQTYVGLKIEIKTSDEVDANITPYATLGSKSGVRLWLVLHKATTPTGEYHDILYFEIHIPPDIFWEDTTVVYFKHMQVGRLQKLEVRSGIIKIPPCVIGEEWVDFFIQYSFPTVTISLNK